MERAADRGAFGMASLMETDDVVVSSDGARRQSLILQAWLFAATLIACAPGPTQAQQPACPHVYVTKETVAMALKPPAATRVPDDVCPPGAGFTQLVYFDDYSWRTFVALVWPALDGERGIPDPEQRLESVPEAVGVPAGPPLVFETYKADWEAFRFDGSDPKQWNAWEKIYKDWSPAQQRCSAAKSFAFFLMPSTKDYSKLTLPDNTKYPDHFGEIDNLMQFGLPFGALVAQNGTIVRYLAAYNQIEFNQIFAKKWYLANNLPKSEKEKITFLDGSMGVKSAWVDMGKVKNDNGTWVMDGPYTVAHPETFHRRLAWLYDPFANPPTCEQHVVGLVGLHIVHKNPDRQAWVWSSFEHVCNVPDHGSTEQSPKCPSYTFNNGNLLGDPMPAQMPDELRAEAIAKRITMPLPALKPVNIERLQPINRDNDNNVGRNTQETNKIWQEGLRQLNSVWQNYQLVMTQWPLTETSNGGSDTTIPGSGFDQSAIANTTLETWRQTDADPKTGCMGCHHLTLQNHHIDFVWSLHVNAWPPETSGDSTVKLLLELLGKLK